MPATGPRDDADGREAAPPAAGDRHRGDDTGKEPVEVGDVVELNVDRVANGGAALGTGPDGRVTFVHGGVPGDRVRATVTGVHRSRLEADVETVVGPAAERVDPPCSHVADGCGGCDWQHIEVEAQRRYRVDIVADCLRRLAGTDDVPVVPGPTLPTTGYRTTVRAAVVNGRASYRLRSSHDTVAVDGCEVAHPLVEELLVEGRFGSAREVVVRAGANTGERMVIVDPDVGGVAVPDGVKLVGRDELMTGRRPHYHEQLGGLRLQISAESFFQCRADGAMVLAELAGDAVADAEGTLLDAYCGVGLFGALAGVGRRVIGVESNPSAAGDAEYNLGPHATVFTGRLERWAPEPVGAVIADPARSGLRSAGVDQIAATGAQAVALISCDAASLARDAKLLAERGYRLERVTTVDLFGHTSHIEAVSRFVAR